MDAKRALALLFTLCLVSFTVAGIYFDQLGTGAFWTPVADPKVARNDRIDVGKEDHCCSIAHQARKRIQPALSIVFCIPIIPG